jgi:hypothetical protein
MSALATGFRIAPTTGITTGASSTTPAPMATLPMLMPFNNFILHLLRIDAQLTPKSRNESLPTRLFSINL